MLLINPQDAHLFGELHLALLKPFITGSPLKSMEWTVKQFSWSETLGRAFRGRTVWTQHWVKHSILRILRYSFKSAELKASLTSPAINRCTIWRQNSFHPQVSSEVHGQNHDKLHRDWPDLGSWQIYCTWHPMVSHKNNLGKKAYMFNIYITMKINLMLFCSIHLLSHHMTLIFINASLTILHNDFKTGNDICFGFITYPVVLRVQIFPSTIHIKRDQTQFTLLLTSNFYTSLPE